MRIIKDPSLVLELQFDENVGNKAIDQSRYDNHGTIKGATWTKGIIGNALKFDGVDDWVEIPHNDVLMPSEEVTVICWVKPLSFVTGHLVSKGEYRGGGYYLFMDKYGRFALALASVDTETAVASSTTKYELGKWYFVVGTYNKSEGKIKIWVNGKFEGEKTWTYGIIPNKLSLSIGSRRGYPPFANAIIDEVKIYNRALSEAEIKKLYLQGLTKIIPVNSHPMLIERGKVLHLTFEEPSGNKVYDISGFKNDGTIYGATRTTGFVGKALSFDGVDDYVRIPGSDSLASITSEITISVWVKPLALRDWAIIRTPFDLNPKAWGLDRYSNNLRFYIYDGGTPYVAKKPWSPETGKWYHIVGTYDGKKLKTYINCSLFMALDHVGAIDSTDKGVVIATRKSTGGEWLFPGLIDDVRVYNRALTEQEIRALYLNYLKKKKKVE